MSHQLRNQFGDLWALSGSTNELGERGNLLGTREAVLQIRPERETQFATGFLHTDKGVAGAASQLTPGARTEFAFLDGIANRARAAVVVQRHFRPVQHQHQFSFVLLAPLAGQIQGLKAGLGRDTCRNPNLQLPLLLQPRGLLVRFEVLLHLPDLPPDSRHSFSRRRTEREQFVARALSLPPT